MWSEAGNRQKPVRKQLFILKSMKLVDMLRPISYTCECYLQLGKMIKTGYPEKLKNFQDLNFQFETDLKYDKCMNKLRTGGGGTAEGLVRDCPHKTNPRKILETGWNSPCPSALAAAKGQPSSQVAQPPFPMIYRRKGDDTNHQQLSPRCT